MPHFQLLAWWYESVTYQQNLPGSAVLKMQIQGRIRLKRSMLIGNVILQRNHPVIYLFLQLQVQRASCCCFTDKRRVKEPPPVVFLFKAHWSAWRAITSSRGAHYKLKPILQTRRANLELQCCEILWTMMQKSSNVFPFEKKIAGKSGSIERVGTNWCCRSVRKRLILTTSRLQAWRCLCFLHLCGVMLMKHSRYG